MTTTISPPVRVLALVGALAAIALGILFYTHSRSSSTGAEPVVPAPSRTARPSATQPPAAKPAVTPKPKLVLLPNLPVNVAHALRFSKVVVVSVYAGGAHGDHALVAQARRGARAAHAGFTAVDVANESSARTVGAFAGEKTAPPVVLVVKRPGRIVNRFDGFVDSAIVAQAAHDAGAGR